MAQDHYKEAAEEDLAQKARRVWYRNRVEEVHRRVTAFDVLRSSGVELKQGDDAPEQFSCPFHGQDNRPSARVYPEDADSKSHAWCFVCQERWDVFSLWAKFNQMEDKPFGQVLSGIERSYGIATPPLPAEAALDDTARLQDAAWEKFKVLYGVCESRLCGSYSSFKYLDEQTGYLRLGSALDLLRYRATNRSINPTQAELLLHKILTKIREKESQCPMG